MAKEKTLKQPATVATQGCTIDLDNRTVAARLFNHTIAALTDQLPTAPSPGEIALIRRVATMILWFEREDAKLLDGKDIDYKAYSTMNQQLRGNLTTLGVKRCAS